MGKIVPNVIRWGYPINRQDSSHRRYYTLGSPIKVRDEAGERLRDAIARDATAFLKKIPVGNVIFDVYSTIFNLGNP